MQDGPDLVTDPRKQVACLGGNEHQCPEHSPEAPEQEDELLPSAHVVEELSHYLRRGVRLVVGRFRGAGRVRGFGRFFSFGVCTGISEPPFKVWKVMERLVLQRAVSIPVPAPSYVVTRLARNAENVAPEVVPSGDLADVAFHE